MKGHDGSPHEESSQWWAEKARQAISSDFLDALGPGGKNMRKIQGGAKIIVDRAGLAVDPIASVFRNPLQSNDLGIPSC
jgi:hypothetical protein